jgi:ATP-binding cassette subfamily F protein 3
MIRLVRECTAEGRLSGQPTREQDLRSFLGNFNFTGDQVKQSVGSMSGGEKARLVLCMIVWQRPNLLLLDEPTNHLDLATREALSVALNEFEGTVMLVSHDRALLRAVCDEFWLVSRGGIEPFDGDLDDYQRYLLDMAKQSREAQRQEQRDAQRAPAVAAVAAPEQKRNAAQRRQQLAEKTKPLKTELEQTEKRMAQLAQDKSRLEATLGQPLSPADLAKNGKQLKAVNDENEALEARWLELTEAIEAVNA